MYSPKHLLGVLSLQVLQFNPFWVYFCVCCKKVAQFDSLACSCLVFPTPCIEETVFFPLYIIISSVIDWLTNRVSMGLFLDSLFYSADLCVCSLMSVPYCLDYCSCEYQLKSENVIFPSLFFFFKVVLAIWSLLFLYKF